MRRLVAVAVGLLALILDGFAWADGSPLQGSVGPGFAISVKDASGAAVSHLDPGLYQLQVSDLSSEHDFHLTGPGGVDVATDVAGVGNSSFSLTLVDGTYTFLCDAHPTRVRGTFTVGTAAPPPPRTTPPPTAPTRLALTVTNTAIVLKQAGAAIKTLAAGDYVVKVVDRSKKQNAHLLGAGANRKTGISFVGATTWKLTLSAGTLVLKSDAAAPKLRVATISVS
jgi:hypothetical protein